eukprot:COSAG06_NODE_824_length_12073_cov_102.305161_14_plen_140_part_00
MKASIETGALRIMAVTTKQNTPAFDQVYQQERAHLDTRLRTETTAQDAPSRSRSRQRASRSPSQGPEAGGAGAARVASPSRVKGSAPFAHLGRYVPHVQKSADPSSVYRMFRVLSWQGFYRPCFRRINLKPECRFNQPQ